MTSTLTPERAAAPSVGTQRTLLCVDDEPNILAALRRLFRHAGCRVLTAGDGPQALEVLAAERVDMIISDMRMPGMDGAELLEQVRRRWPDITRVLLTGHADVKSTIAAINRGEIYRYIHKPWNDEELLLLVQQALERLALHDETRRLEALTKRQNEELKTLNASLEQKVAERTAELAGASERIKKNYLNSIKVLSNLIELRGGHINGHARKVADLARRTAQHLGLSSADTHEVFIAGLLHDIGNIGLPEAVLAIPVPLMSPEDRAVYVKHPVLAEQALMPLDDMKGVAALIRSHHERLDGQGFPDGLKGEAIPFGARILAVIDTYDDLQSGHLSRVALSADEARTMLQRGRGSQFDAKVVDAFVQVLVPTRVEVSTPTLELKVDALKVGMVLARDLRSAEGVMLLATDHVLTGELIQRIRGHALRGRMLETMVLHVRA